MSRLRSTAFVLSLLTSVILASVSPPGTFCPCGIQVGGTVAASDQGTIVIEFGGTPQPGKFSGTSIAARIWGRTVFLPYLSRNNLPGRGMPVVVTLDAERNGDGSYRLTQDSDGRYRINEIWANVR